MNWHPRLRDISHSHGTTIALVVGGELIVGLLIFHAGTAFGERHALSRMHMGRQLAPVLGMGFLPHGFMPDEHGAVGTIMNITLPLLTLKTRDGREESVRIASSTQVRSTSADPSVDQLKVGQSVIVLGDPDDTAPGDIDARLIRILSSN